MNLKYAYGFFSAILRLRRTIWEYLVVMLTSKIRSKIALEDFVAKFRPVSKPKNHLFEVYCKCNSCYYFFNTDTYYCTLFG